MTQSSADGVVTTGVVTTSTNRCIPTPSIVRALTRAADDDDPTTTTTTSDAVKAELKEARAFVTALVDAFDKLSTSSSSSASAYF
jgi:hypothetical protein